jgi:signal transduction histidine kinase
VADAKASSAKGLGVLLVLAVVALFEVLSLLQGVRSLRRLQGRVVTDAEARLAAARPLLDTVLARGGPGAWDEAAAVAVERRLASEVEVVDASGRSLFSRPTVAPVSYDLRPEQRATLAAGGMVSVAAQAGGTVRVLSYVPMANGRALRLSAAAGDLQQEVRERQQVFLGHLTALAVLGVAALLVLRRPPAGGAAPASTGALEAYEAAMGRLRDHGEEEKARHDAEKRRMEEAVREKEALARAGELTAGIVHEVRNGLGTIVGYARMLERGDAGAPAAGGAAAGRSGVAATAAEAGRAIREECETLEVVVRRFHDFVRAEKLQLAPVDLGRLVARVLARELRGRDVEGAVGATERPLVVQADEELLERAFENLVRNAADAALDGGHHVRLTLGTDGGDVLVTVLDDGPGLPGGAAEFRLFASSKPGGLGLGLPMAAKLVRLHGGELRLRDAPGGGAEALVRLPLGGPPAA